MRGLAALALDQRAPLLGAIEPLLRHADAEVRAAAVAALAGADGLRAVRALVACLDDAHAAVRAAAVEALRASSEQQPARYAHALFHGRQDVRVHALSTGAPAGASALVLHAAAAAPPSLLLADVLEVGWDEAIRSCAFTRGRSDAEVDRALRDGEIDASDAADAAESGSSGAERDVFDDLFERLRDVRRDADDRTLADALACWPVEVQRRVVVSLLGVARVHGAWTPRYARACTRVFPGFLRWSAVPRAVRRAAVGVFHDAGGSAPALDDEQVHALLGDPLFVDDARLLDLWALAALLRCVKRGAIRKARRWLGTPRILRAMAADPLGAVTWVEIEDDSARGRADLLRMARRAHPDAAARALAGATLVESDAGKERLLAELDGYECALVLAHAVDLELAGIEAHAGARLAALLAPRVAPDWMLTLLRPLAATRTWQRARWRRRRCACWRRRWTRSASPSWSRSCRPAPWTRCARCSALPRRARQAPWRLGALLRAP
ncbi:MAG: HEAT repeat domain-containing protein [Polyangiaceae bacterium]